MAVISGGVVMPASASGHPATVAGAPSNGADEVQTIAIGGTPEGGTFTLTFDGHTTAAITWSATNGTLVSNANTALEALPNIGTDGVTVGTTTMTSGVGTLSVTFDGSNVCKRNVAAMTATSSLTGTTPTITIATATVGTLATAWGAEKGAPLTDTDNGIAYINTGTAATPTWTKTGTQS
jgi:hypothetical protein